jgi:WhiB family transcriptional regulator, redox-sensing transcriptional regulator
MTVVAGHGVTARTFLIERPGWQMMASCRGAGTEAFFAEGKRNRESDRLRARAYEVCTTCPVRLDCLRFALDQPEDDDHGVWGGTSKSQRRRARRRGLTARQLVDELEAVPPPAVVRPGKSARRLRTSRSSRVADGGRRTRASGRRR